MVKKIQVRRVRKNKYVGEHKTLTADKKKRDNLINMSPMTIAIL